VPGQAGATAIGYIATAGDNGTAIGQASNASGSDALALGRGASATAANAVAIGANVTAAQANSIILGDNTAPLFNVGIGTATPNFGLEAAGSVGLSSIAQVSTSTYTVVADDFFIVVNGGSGTTVTLPTPSPTTRGRMIVVKSLVTSTVFVSASGNVMIDTGATSGTANVVLSSGQQGTFISGGTFWYRIN